MEILVRIRTASGACMVSTFTERGWAGREPTVGDIHTLTQCLEGILFPKETNWNR